MPGVVVVVGSRRWPLPDAVKRLIDSLPQDTEVVSGGQPKGVDGWARAYALNRGLKYTEFPPDHYHKGPHSATMCPITDRAIEYGQMYRVEFFHIRNQRMVVYAKKRGGFAFVFWCQGSTGSDSFLRFCKKHQLSHHIFSSTGTEYSCYYFGAKCLKSDGHGPFLLETLGNIEQNVSSRQDGDEKCQFIFKGTR